jgi:hypothetical protein
MVISLSVTGSFQSCVAGSEKVITPQMTGALESSDGEARLSHKPNESGRVFKLFTSHTQSKLRMGRQGEDESQRRRPFRK